MTCRDVEAFLEARFAGDGPDELPEALAAHAEACPRCRGELEIEGALDRVAEGLREVALGAPIAAEVVARLPAAPGAAPRPARWPLVAAGLLAVTTVGLGRRMLDSMAEIGALRADLADAERRTAEAAEREERLATALERRARPAAVEGEVEPHTELPHRIDPAGKPLLENDAEGERRLNEYKQAMERSKNQAFAAMADNQRLQEELVSREQHISDLTEELQEYKSKIEHLRTQGIDVARLAETKVPAPIDAKIVAVHAGAGLVMVNAGEKHGAQKGMNFTVYRGEQYVGQVIVEEVFPDMASARIDTRFQKQEVREGDDATTRIR